MKQTQKDKKMAKLRLHGNISKKSNDNFQYTVKAYSLNPLNPKSAKYLISPYNITPESHTKVTRIKEMVSREETIWLANKFSL